MIRVTAAGTIVYNEGEFVDTERMDWLNDVIGNVAALRRILT